MKKILFIVSLLLISNTYAYKDDCYIYTTEVFSNKYFNSLDKKLEKLDKHEANCKNFEFHDINRVIIYGKFRKLSEAKHFVKNKLKAASYDTKELESSLGVIFADLGEVSELFDYSKKLIKKYPDWYGGYYHLGAAYLMMDELNDAEKYLKKSLSLNRNYFQSYSVLSFVYFKKGNSAKHLKCWKISYKIDPAGTLLFYGPSCAAAISLCEEGSKKSLRIAKRILDFSRNNIEDIDCSKNYQYALLAYDKAVSNKN